MVDAADLLVLVGNGASVQLDHHGVDDDPDCGGAASSECGDDPIIGPESDHWFCLTLAD